MESSLRHLYALASEEVDTPTGRALLRTFRSHNRFDAVHASVTWTSSGGDRWGRVEVDRGEYVAHLYERIEREAVTA